MQDTAGNFVGLADFRIYASTPTLVASLRNSVFVAVMATAITVPLAFLYAYALTRTTFRTVTAPICMPAILDIAVYLFVNAMTTVSAVIFLYGSGPRCEGPATGTA